MGIWCLSLASPICGYYEEHWFITNNDIRSQKVQKVNKEIEQIYIGKDHLNMHNYVYMDNLMLPCFLVLIAKKRYPQIAARLVSLFSLVTRSPLHATLTRWELCKLAMTALTIILAQALGLCMFKPPYSNRPYRIWKYIRYNTWRSAQYENGRIRST